MAGREQAAARSGSGPALTAASADVRQGPWQHRNMRALLVGGPYDGREVEVGELEAKSAIQRLMPPERQPIST